MLSPGNTRQEMADKLAFYDRYSVEEYYLYDPDAGRLQGWLRQGERLVEIARMSAPGWDCISIWSQVGGAYLCPTCTLSGNALLFA